MSDLSAQIRQALAELELVSHAPIQGYNYAPPVEGRKERWRTTACCVYCRNRGKQACEHREPVPHLGQHVGKGGDTKKPTGIDREYPESAEEKDSLRESYHGKTITHYRTRLAQRGASVALLTEIRQTTRAWRVMQIPEGQPPALGDAQWKRWVAESKKDGGELARLFGVSRQYINQVRKAYREEAA